MSRRCNSSFLGFWSGMITPDDFLSILAFFSFRMPLSSSSIIYYTWSSRSLCWISSFRISLIYFWLARIYKFFSFKASIWLVSTVTFAMRSWVFWTVSMVIWSISCISSWWKFWSKNCSLNLIPSINFLNFRTLWRIYFVFLKSFSAIFFAFSCKILSCFSLASILFVKIYIFDCIWYLHFYIYFQCAFFIWSSSLARSMVFLPYTCSINNQFWFSSSSKSSLIVFSKVKWGICFFAASATI